MSSSNPINLYNLDGRYTTLSQVDAKISAQASADASLYATQSTVAGKAAIGAQQPTSSIGVWVASTVYAKGQLVLSPVGAYTANVTSLIQANTSFTSGVSFSAGNWTQVSDLNLPVGTTSGSVAAGNDSRLTAVTANTAAISTLTLTPTATKTANYSALAQDLVLADATGGGFTVTLPTAPADATLVEVKKLDVSANTVAVSTGGSDTFGIGGTSLALVLQGHGVLWRYQSSTAKWIALNNDLPYAAVEARYLTQVNASTTYQPKPSSGTASSTTYLRGDGSWATPSTGALPYSPQVAINSWLLDPSVGGTNQTGFSNGDLVIGPHYLPAATYDTIAVNVASSGSANAVFKLAVYSDAGTGPGTLITQSAAIDATTSGIKQVTLSSSFTTTGGLVWAGLVTQGAPATFPQYTRPNSTALAMVFASVPTDFGSGSSWAFVTSGVTSTLPATWATTSRTDVFPRLAFKRSA